jgi:integrase
MVRGLEQRGLSARTATLARDILRIALSQAVSDELIARNVAELVRRPKAGRRLGPVLSVDQGSAFLASLSGHRLEAVVTCGLTLGLRLGEVLGLQWSDVDLRARQLKIRHALQTLGKRRELVDLKSEESHRELALPTVVVRAIERHRVGQAERRLAAGSQWKKSDFVFTTRSGRPLDGTLVTRDLKRLLARTWMGGESDCDHERERDHVCLDCGATRLPIVSFHALRHSCASLLLAEGVPTREVSDLLGHSDVALTLRTYTHIIKAQRQRTAGVIDRMFDSQTDSQTVGQGQK